MEYIYAGMLLHKAGQPINEENVKKVLTAAGVKAQDAMVKSLVASLQGVNIDEAIKEASTMQVAAAPTTTGPAEQKKEEKKEEKKPAEEAAQGLGLLFG